MKRLLLASVLCLAGGVAGGIADAQERAAPAALVADAIRFDRAELVAEGAVEVAVGDRVLRARRLTYLRDEDRLIVEGPLTLVDGTEAVLVADFASLDAGLRDAVLRGARVVFERRLQVAADAVLRDGDGGITELRRAVASSCEVCPDDPVPVWQVRARRIVNDERRQRVTFEDARFEVLGVPIAWLPRLTVPSPGVERATGLLAPRFSSDGRLGTGVTLPYFLALGPSRDLTLSPYATDRGTRALGLRYRQAFVRGALEVEASAARDDLRPGATRGHLDAAGAFDLPRGYGLRFDVEAVTDDAYLTQYDISDRDRLESRLALFRVERDERFLGEAVAFRTLRDGERSDALPSRVVTVTRERRHDLLGGIAFWQLEAHGRERPLGDVPDGLPAGSARDVARLSASTGWRRSAVAPGGVVLAGFAQAHLDHYEVRQDETGLVDASVTRLVPYLGATARWPLVRQDRTGRAVLEPVAQVVLSRDDVDAVPNEDSLVAEFDEGNLLATSRFAGRDRREVGSRASLGLSYALDAADGWTVDAYAGRILRWSGDDDQFDAAEEIGGAASDWLMALGVSRATGAGGRFGLRSRSLLDAARLSLSETALQWSGPRHDLETRVTFVEADTGAGRTRDTSEWALDAAYEIRRDWTGRVGWRYDFTADEATRAGVGLTYRSDCVTVALDVERRFTETESLRPTTRVGLAIELAGFGAADAPRRRRCGT